MRDITAYSDEELSLEVFNTEYFYIERSHSDFLWALINEEFIYTPEQATVLQQDLDAYEEEYSAGLNIASDTEA